MLFSFAHLAFRSSYSHVRRPTLKRLVTRPPTTHLNSNMPGIELENIVKTFPGGFTAVDDVSLSIEDGEFMVLVGPSGCGKTTVLRMIAGLEPTTEGLISIGTTDVTRVPARDRNVAMVFQNYALYPNMTVRENLGYGLKVRKTPKAEIARRVEEAARMLRLEDMLDRRPAALSGGQRQRVAMGRAIVREPQAFLMDEPLSNLDAKLRVSMRAELERLHTSLRVTTVYVTHDQVEAMTLGQRVAVMRDGRIQQVDKPQVLYREPVNLFVAAFIGSPAMNLVEATVEADLISFGGYQIPLEPRHRLPASSPDRVILGVRPEHFEDAAFAITQLPTIDVVVDVVEELGADTHVFFNVDAPPVEIQDVRSVTVGEELQALDNHTVFTARINPSSSARVGSKLTVAVDPRHFHFFDRESGLRLLPKA